MEKIDLKKKLVLLLFLCQSLYAPSQTFDKNSSYFVSAIGFWNVENLYDTLNDPWKNDEDFTPDGINNWDGKKYWKKIDRLSEVIAQIAIDATPDGLAIIGL